MKRLFVYFLSVIMGVCVIDITYRIVCSYNYTYPSNDSSVKTDYTFIHCDIPCKMVFLGASYTQHSFVTQQVEDSLRIPAYNMGWAGRCVYYQYLSLMKAIHNGGLETAVLSLSLSQLSDSWIYDRVSDLYPYYWYSDTIRGIVNEVKGKNMDILMCSGLIQFNSTLANFFRSQKNMKGYIPLKYTGHPAKKTPDKNIDTINPIAVKYLEKMANECKNNNVRFIVCLTPNLRMKDKEIHSLVNLCDSIGIEIWNMTHTIRDPYLFKDDTHLNEKGAEQFTSEFIERFRNRM